MIFEVTPRDWKSLIAISDDLPRYVFRGQRNFDWALTTSLERLALRYMRTLEYLPNRERWILTQFKRRAHNVVDSLPQANDSVEWLTLIQHFGGPTRFLDATKSFLVALFFACEDASAEADAAVWLFDYHHLLDAYKPPSEDDTMYDAQCKVTELASTKIGAKTEVSGIMPVEPERLSNRMSIQQGLCLLPTDVKQSFMENLRAQYQWEKITYKDISLAKFISRHAKSRTGIVAKIRIKSAWTAQILRFLDEANINANTLFPGLDGFARSLKIHLAGPGAIMDAIRNRKA